MRGGLVAAAVVVVLVLSACGGGVPQAEHDQLLAELGLTQQELADAKRELAATSQTGQSESERAEALEARIDQIVRDNNIVLGAQQDPLDELGRMIADFHQREQALMEEMEAILSEGAIEAEEVGPDAVAGSAISAYLDLAMTINRWLSQGELPDWQEVSVLGNAVEEASDPELFAVWEEFAGTYDEQEPGAQRVWLSDLARLALERIGASLPV